MNRRSIGDDRERKLLEAFTQAKQPYDFEKAENGQGLGAEECIAHARSFLNFARSIIT